MSNMIVKIFASFSNLRIGDTLLPFVLQIIDVFTGETFQTTAGFQDSDTFQKAIKIVLECILSVISHLSGFKL